MKQFFRFTSKYVSCVIALILVMTLTVQVFAFESFTVDGDELTESFANEYGWDTEAMTQYEWTGSDGETYQRIYSQEVQYFNDALEAQEAMAVDYNLITLSSAYGGGGFDIVRIALQEAALPAEERSERPMGSNNVKYNTWYYGHQVSGSAYPWCAAFVSWCADQCGYIDSGLFCKAAGCSAELDYLKAQGFETFPTYTCENFGGSGPAAQLGDIVFWHDGQYYSHIGIVTEVGPGYVNITQGNSSDTVQTIQYTKASLSSGLRNPRSVIVHVEYPNDYHTIYSFLRSEMDMNCAASCGVVANIYFESGFDPNIIGDGGTSYGLCQWHNTSGGGGYSGYGRWRNMIDFCETNGYDWQSMTGQLWWLKYELEHNETYAYSTIISVPDTADGAYRAGYNYCKWFERPADQVGQPMYRGYAAQYTYWPEFSVLEGY